MSSEFSLKRFLSLPEHMQFDQFLHPILPAVSDTDQKLLHDLDLVIINAGIVGDLGLPGADQANKTTWMTVENPSKLLGLSVPVVDYLAIADRFQEAIQIVYHPTDYLGVVTFALERVDRRIIFGLNTLHGIVTAGPQVRMLNEDWIDYSGTVPIEPLHDLSIVSEIAVREAVIKF